MKNRDLVSSLFLLAFGLFICIFSLKYGVGRLGAPGPGFLSLLSGFILIILSSILLISTVKKEKKAEKQAANFFPEKDSLRKTSISVLILLAYSIVLESLGFVVTTLLFMLFVLRFVESQSQKTTVIAALLATVFSYLLFVSMLKSQMPKGILGI